MDDRSSNTEFNGVNTDLVHVETKRPKGRGKFKQLASTSVRLTSTTSSAKAESETTEQMKSRRPLSRSTSSPSGESQTISGTPSMIPMSDSPSSKRKRGTAQAKRRLSPRMSMPAPTSSDSTKRPLSAKMQMLNPPAPRKKRGPSSAQSIVSVSPRPSLSEQNAGADHKAVDILQEHVSTSDLQQDGGDRPDGDTHSLTVTAINPAARESGHEHLANQTSNVGLSPLNAQGEEDHGKGATQPAVVNLAPEHQSTIAEIREQWRRRQSWHRSEKSLTLAAKAMCRRLVATAGETADLKEADALYNAALGKGTHAHSEVAFGAIMPLVRARDLIESERKAVEKRLAKLAKTLPVASFVEGLRGVGIGSLAAIVGECGDLGMYANPAKVWKRMGLAVMPDGGRQRCVAGVDALMHGYSPQRRSVMWTLGDSIVKTGGPLREMYDARKIREHEKAKEEGLTVLPAAKIPKKDADKYRSEGHIHSRAKRYVEKQVLKMIWSAWRK